MPGAPGVYSQKRDKFNSLLGDLINYTEAKGTATHSKEVGEKFLEAVTPGGLKRTADGSQFDPRVVVDPVGLRFPAQGVDTGSVSTPYNQPDWLSLGEKNVKNYVKRLARVADKHREGAGLKRQIEAKLADLSQKKKDYDGWGYKGSDYEFYKRLAGEAEARAVQKRLEMADIEAGGYGPYDPDTFDPTNVDEVYDPEYFRQVPTELYDVPKSELAFVRDRKGLPFSRSQAAKTQAKTNARKMLAQ